VVVDVLPEALPESLLFRRVMCGLSGSSSVGFVESELVEAVLSDEVVEVVVLGADLPAKCGRSGSELATIGAGCAEACKAGAFGSGGVGLKLP
jgi:hypothetical protein